MQRLMQQMRLEVLIDVWASWKIKEHPKVYLVTTRSLRQADKVTKTQTECS